MARGKRSERNGVGISQNPRGIALKPRGALASFDLAQKRIDRICRGKVQKRRQDLAHALAGRGTRIRSPGKMPEGKKSHREHLPEVDSRCAVHRPKVAYRVDKRVGSVIELLVFRYLPLLAARCVQRDAPRARVAAPAGDAQVGLALRNGVEVPVAGVDVAAVLNPCDHVPGALAREINKVAKASLRLRHAGAPAHGIARPFRLRRKRLEMRCLAEQGNLDLLGRHSSASLTMAPARGAIECVVYALS